MRWTTQRSALFGEVEETDRLADIARQACRQCAVSFDSVALTLDELTFVDADDSEALSVYCRDVTDGGGHPSIRVTRPALRRLLLAGPASDFVAAESNDDPGGGKPYGCPHRS